VSAAAELDRRLAGFRPNCHDVTVGRADRFQGGVQIDYFHVRTPGVGIGADQDLQTLDLVSRDDTFAEHAAQLFDFGPASHTHTHARSSALIMR
jgi:hypothetical protein